jgi:phosphoesterase RecJ-like protein
MEVSNIDLAISQRLKTANKILVVSHVRPDGDAIGSLLALGLALEHAGKNVSMVLADGVPANFKYLSGSRKVTHKVAGEFDLIAVVDCSDQKRVGPVLDGYHPDICIDHHLTNENYATINLVDADAVATASILAERLPAWGYQITPDIANALLTGLVSDTLGFRTSNITPQSLRQAAGLMEKGADLPRLYHHALVARSFEAARYWGTGLYRLQREHRLIWTSLTLVDRKVVNYPGRDDADLVNVLSAIEDTDIAVIFVEQKDRIVKISWRSQPGFDVSKIAFNFGGGGHAAAAGAEISGTLEEVQAKVLQATRIMLNLKTTDQSGS